MQFTQLPPVTPLSAAVAEAHLIDTQLHDICDQLAAHAFDDDQHKLAFWDAWCQWRNAHDHAEALQRQLTDEEGTP